jgi:hypothetical protein
MPLTSSDCSPPKLPALRRAIRHARGRLWLARAGDGLLIGTWSAAGLLAVGAAASFVIPSAWIVGCAAAACAALAALVWTACSRPTVAAAADWLDRIHGLQDLLSTGLLIHGDDAVVAIVHARAEAVASTLPRPDWPGRFGSRAFVATLLVAGATTVFGWTLPPNRDPGAQSMLAAIDDPREPAAAGETVLAAGRPADAAAPADPETELPASGMRLRQGAGDRQGDTPGVGAGRVDVSGSRHASVARESEGRTSPATSPNAGGFVSARGDGNAADTITRSGPATASSGGSIRQVPGSVDPSPWELRDWPAHQAAAESTAGHLPDAYRPLVRAYFQR